MKNYVMMIAISNLLQEYENSTMKNEYQYLYKKDEELKGDNIVDDSVVEYGNDFINYKIIHSKQ